MCWFVSDLLGCVKARSDIVSVHCGLTEKTKKMFNLAAFKKMKKTAVFVNTSRFVLSFLLMWL